MTVICDGNISNYTVPQLLLFGPGEGVINLQDIFYSLYVYRGREALFSDVRLFKLFAQAHIVFFIGRSVDKVVEIQILELLHFALYPICVHCLVGCMCTLLK